MAQGDEVQGFAIQALSKLFLHAFVLGQEALQEGVVVHQPQRRGRVFFMNAS